ncbi:MAG TPA: apolipoprotein N-acyltransferase [Phycisphaerales bacterium]|nr:apolipoprotein N-acyltransferase [Phycisphaerales bacterium]
MGHASSESSGNVLRASKFSWRHGASGFFVGLIGSIPVIATTREWISPILAMSVIVLAAMQPLRRAHYVGALAGAMIMWGISQWWTFQVASLGFVPLLAVQAFWLVLTMWSLARIRTWLGWRRMTLLAPVVMVAIEFFRCEVFMGGYAWGMYAQWATDTLLARFAPVAGLYGASFVACIIASAFAFAVAKYCHSWTFASFSLPEEAPSTPAQDQRNRSIMLATLFALVPLIVALVAGQFGEADSSRSFPVASVQTNVPQSNKTYWTLEAEVRDYREMQKLSEKAAATGSELIIWPETMMPGISIEPDAIAEMEAKGLFFNLKQPMPEELGTSETRIKATAFWEALALHSEKIKTPLLIGEEGLEGFSLKVASDGAVDMSQRARFNSAYLVQGGKVTGERYDKMELTPFGEYMPVIGRFPWLQDKLLGLAAAGMKFDLTAGTKKTVFTLPFIGNQVRFVAPICFEITESTVCRDLVFANGERRADFMVNLSNDGWFQGSDAAREQHLRIAQWRCMELGTPMVRSANTGISAVIDAHGRIVKRGVADNAVGTQVAGVLAADLPLPTGEPTLYARTGNWLGWGCLGAWVLVTTIAVVRSRQQLKQG